MMKSEDRWPISSGTKQAVVDRMLSIIKSSSDAAAIDAAKILMKLEEQNLEFDFDFGADDDDDDDDEEWKFA